MRLPTHAVRQNEQAKRWNDAVTIFVIAAHTTDVRLRTHFDLQATLVAHGASLAWRWRESSEDHKGPILASQKIFSDSSPSP